ncbi:MAG: right-handed parallel beta-helix repeat-containing protein [Planctomycetota bacterium]
MVQVASRGELHHVPGSWMVADGGEGLYVHFPPGRVPLEQWRLEISARSRCFAPYRRGLGHIHVRGFTMIGGASDFPRGFYKEGKSPQVGVMGTRAGHHWVIEHNVIRYGKSLGLDIGLEGKSDADGLGQPEPDIPEDNGTSGRHIVRHNVISDHGAGGIAGLKAYGSVITDNVIERNNRLGFTAPEIGGIKLHFFGDGLIARNLVRDNHCYGVWLDNMYHRARVTRNAIVNNQGSGVFIELGHGPVLIDHNVIALTRPLAQQPGDGLYSHDASGVTFAHNLVLFNAHFGLWAHVATDRQPRRYQDGRRGERSPAEASGWTVVNNLFIGNTAGALGLPPEADRAHGNRVDHNLYAGTYPRSTVETFGAMLGATTFRLNTNKGRLPGEAVDLNLEAWRQRTGWDQHSHFLPVLRPQLATGTMRLLLTAGPPLDLEATPVDGTDVDYFGYPLGTHPRVGPFQSLAVEKALRASAETPDSVAPFVDLGTGHQNHLLLWPLRPSPPEASSGDAGTQKE